MYLGCATYTTHVHGKYVGSTNSANKGKFPGRDTNPLWVVSEMTSDLEKKICHLLWRPLASRHQSTVVLS